MTAPMNRMAPTFGLKDRTGDRTEITIPTREVPGGGTVTELEALILKTVEDALAASGVPPAATAAGYDAEALKQLMGYLGGVEIAGSTRPNQTPTMADVRRHFPALALGAVAPQLAVQADRLTAADAKIAALEGKAYTVADTAWTACTMEAGITEKLWTRVWKGRVIFKSALTAGGTASSFQTGRLTSTSSWTKIATLPASIPKPSGNNTDWYTPVATYQMGGGTPYGAGVFGVFGTSGSIQVLTGHVAMDGFYPISITGYPVGAWT